MVKTLGIPQFFPKFHSICCGNMFDIPPMAPPPGAAPQPNGWDGSGNAFKRVLEEVRLFEYAAQQAPTNVSASLSFYVSL